MKHLILIFAAAFMIFTGCENDNDFIPVPQLNNEDLIINTDLAETEIESRETGGSYVTILPGNLNFAHEQGSGIYSHDLTIQYLNPVGSRIHVNDIAFTSTITMPVQLIVVNPAYNPYPITLEDEGDHINVILRVFTDGPARPFSSVLSVHFDIENLETGDITPHAVEAKEFYLSITPLCDRSITGGNFTPTVREGEPIEEVFTFHYKLNDPNPALSSWVRQYVNPQFDFDWITWTPLFDPNPIYFSGTDEYTFQVKATINPVNVGEGEYHAIAGFQHSWKYSDINYHIAYSRLVNLYVNVIPAPDDPAELDETFDEMLSNGTIVFNNNGNLTAFQNQLDKAIADWENGKFKQACKKLEWLYLRSDGLPTPDDMVFGEDAVLLNSYIQGVMDEIGCGTL